MAEAHTIQGIFEWGIHGEELVIGNNTKRFFFRLRNIIAVMMNNASHVFFIYTANNEISLRIQGTQENVEQIHALRGAISRHMQGQDVNYTLPLGQH